MEAERYLEHLWMRQGVDAYLPLQTEICINHLSPFDFFQEFKTVIDSTIATGKQPTAKMWFCLINHTREP